MSDYKSEYNFTLKRYYNGIKYLSENPNEVGKFLPLLEDIMCELDSMIKKYNIQNENILKGFV